MAFNISSALTTLLKPGSRRGQEQGGTLGVISSLWMLLLYIYRYFIFDVFNNKHKGKCAGYSVFTSNDNSKSKFPSVRLLDVLFCVVR